MFDACVETGGGPHVCYWCAPPYRVSTPWYTYCAMWIDFMKYATLVSQGILTTNFYAVFMPLLCRFYATFGIHFYYLSWLGSVQVRATDVVLPWGDTHHWCLATATDEVALGLALTDNDTKRKKHVAFYGIKVAYARLLILMLNMA